MARAINYRKQCLDNVTGNATNLLPSGIITYMQSNNLSSVAMKKKTVETNIIQIQMSLFWIILLMSICAALIAFGKELVTGNKNNPKVKIQERRYFDKYGSSGAQGREEENMSDLDLAHGNLLTRETCRCTYMHHMHYAGG